MNDMGEIMNCMEEINQAFPLISAMTRGQGDVT